ncbi:MAG: DUF502 domain-containing protein [Coxiellaceae bacterium]|nr:DUF502 domain-containing protein [Coxiellaceae bacterium]
MSRFRKYIVAGLLVWLPILVTYFILRFLLRLINSVSAVIPQKYQPAVLLGHHVPGFGIILSIVVIFVTGILVTHFLGHKIVAVWEKLLARIPLVRSIYGATKQVVHSVLSPSEQAFSRAVLIEFPRTGVWSVGFQTNSDFPHTDIENNITVFVPTAPNPTSGFMMIVREEQIRPLNITIEEAFKMIISVGVVTPQHRDKTVQPVTQEKSE